MNTAVDTNVLLDILCDSPSHREASLHSLLQAGDEGTPVGALAEAGRLWRAYRDRGGPRTRMVADFLVGSHALFVSDRLLTRDRGFYAAHFKGFPVWDPQTRTPPTESAP